MRASELYLKMAELGERGVPFVLATVVEVKGSSPRGVGTKMLVLADGLTVETIGGGALEKQVIADALDCMSAGLTRMEQYELRKEGEHALGTVCGGEATVFLELNNPDPTLLMIGAGHVGQRLCPCAKLLDFRVVVVDSRPEMVTAERFPQADELICGDPGKVAELFSIGPTTHVVIATHGHVHDKAALSSVVASNAAYIGMIGSNSKVRTVFGELAAEGVDSALLERVHSPVGLDIGAETPAELALCIMAEIVADRHGKVGREASGTGGSSGSATNVVRGATSAVHPTH
jgi:xanthine dehydrogenase accessory factor